MHLYKPTHGKGRALNKSYTRHNETVFRRHILVNLNIKLFISHQKKGHPLNPHSYMRLHYVKTEVRFV